MDDLFVVAVAKATGRKQRIPAHWLELSAAGVPGFDFEATPSAKAVVLTKEQDHQFPDTVKETGDAA